jgi:hypothetical protein
MICTPAALAGDGGFIATPGSPVAADDGPVSIATGDFNGDGDQDLAVANSDGDSITALAGGPGPSFTGPFGQGSASAADNPSAVSVGDFNGDGDEDLAAADPAAGNLEVFAGGAGTSFAAPLTFAEAGGAAPLSSAVGDFNLDGDDDVAVANQNATVGIFTGGAGASFSAPATTFATGGNLPLSIAVGDFNGDGDEDLATANNTSQTVSVLLGGPGSTFAPSAGSPVAVGGQPSSVAVGDFNDDGNDDVAVATHQDAVILAGSPNASFLATAVPVSGKPVSLAVGDFNGDNDQDLAVTLVDSQGVGILTGGSGASFSLTSTLHVDGNGPIAGAVGDWDGDGNEDLAAANNGSDNVSVFTGTGTPWQADNLLVNGGAEGPGAATDGTTAPAPFGWQVEGPMTFVRYGTFGGFPRMLDAPRTEGGMNFFAGGPGAAQSAATQTVDVSSSAASIDAGLATARLAARLGGYRTQSDRVGVSSTFLDASGAALGSIIIPPVTPGDRDNRTILLARSATAPVPPGTRQIVVRLAATRTGGFYIDAYADNVELNLGASPPGTPDMTAPETTIDKAPKRRSHQRKVTILFSSSEPGSTFECRLDKGDFAPCSSPFKDKVKRKRHRFLVRAIDAAGNVDPTPDDAKFKVLKRK